MTSKKSDYGAIHMHMTKSAVAGSIFGEGSLTMIIAILALVASAASICLTVVLFKKNAVSATANGAYKSDDEE